MVRYLTLLYKPVSVFRRWQPGDFFKLFVEMAYIIESTVESYIHNAQIFVH